MLSAQDQELWFSIEDQIQTSKDVEISRITPLSDSFPAEYKISYKLEDGSPKEIYVDGKILLRSFLYCMENFSTKFPSKKPVISYPAI